MPISLSGCVCLGLIFLTAANVNTGENDSLFPVGQRWGNMLLPVFLGSALHESGHAAAALACGADSIWIKPFPLAFPPYMHMELNESASHYGLKRALICCCGFAAARLTAEAVKYWLNHSQNPRWLEGLGGAHYVMFRADLPMQYLWGLSMAVMAPDRAFPDFTKITKFGFNNEQPWLAVFYLTAGALIAADIYFTRHDIAKNYQRAMGRFGGSPPDQAALGAGPKYSATIISIKF